MINSMVNYIYYLEISLTRILLEGTVVAVLSVENACSRLTIRPCDAKPGDPEEKQYVILDDYRDETTNEVKKVPGMSGDVRHLSSYLSIKRVIRNLAQVVAKVVARGERPIFALKAGEYLSSKGSQDNF